MARQWVKLRNPGGMHYDDALKFLLRGGEKKPLPDPLPIGSLTHQRYKQGAIVDCDPPAKTQSGETDIPAPTPPATEAGITQDGSANTAEPGPAEGATEEELAASSPPPAPQPEPPAAKPKRTRKPRK